MDRREHYRKRFTPYFRPRELESDATNTTAAEHSPRTAASIPAHVPSLSKAGARVQLSPKEANVNPGPTAQPKTSFFENASNIVMNQPIIGNVQINGNLNNLSVLKEMLEHVIPGAEYDSSARDTPPRCHPGTRTQILEDIQTRIHDPDTATRMIWIHGAAGVGKSAIMQTLAEAESSSQATFTTLFFSRPNERDEPKKVFTTLAYGLAVLNTEYRSYIGQHLQDEPTFLGKSMEEQFRRLFITPFLEGHVSFGSQRWIIFLDGLDECRGEREQCRIVDLINDSVLRHLTSTPLIWVIASRPEAHLKVAFTKAKANVESFWDLEVPIDSDQSSQDVERYLHAQFSKICESYPDSIPPLWPSESDFLTLSKASSGLFVFASTLVAYLLDGDPVSRLNHILALIESSKTYQSSRFQQNPFRMLDLLYTQIMSDVPKEVLLTTMRILGFYLLQAVLASSSVAPTFLVANNVLELGQHIAYAALRKLHSVIECPPIQMAEFRPLRFLHASFSDFLRDPSRSQEYYIDLSQEASGMWSRYSKVLCDYESSRGKTELFYFLWPLLKACLDDSCIDLSWSPRSIGQAALRRDVLDTVRECWMSTLFLLPRFHPPTDVHFAVEESTLIETFRRLGSTMFVRNGDAHVPITEFLDWLSNYAPLGVQKTFLREEFHLQDLDIERLIKSLCVHHWCFCLSSNESSGKVCFENVDLESTVKFNTTQWVKAKDVFWTKSGLLSDLVQAPGWTPSRVLGFEPSKQFVVVGPIDIWSLDQQVFYILPYSSEFSRVTNNDNTSLVDLG